MYADARRHDLKRKHARFLTVAIVLLALAGLFAVNSRAAAPVGRYTISADTVADLKTGLLWQRQAAATSSGYSLATSACGTLSLGGSPAGTWRVPTLKELQTLVDWRATGTAIDATAFPGPYGAADNFWSATANVSSLGLYWVVSFERGNNGYLPQGTAARVRCVH